MQVKSVFGREGHTCDLFPQCSGFNLRFGNNGAKGDAAGKGAERSGRAMLSIRHCQGPDSRSSKPIASPSRVVPNIPTDNCSDSRLATGLIFRINRLISTVPAAPRTPAPPLLLDNYAEQPSRGRARALYAVAQLSKEALLGRHSIRFGSVCKQVPMRLFPQLVYLNPYRCWFKISPYTSLALASNFSPVWPCLVQTQTAGSAVRKNVIRY